LSTALVTGAIERIHGVAMALKREGFNALAWEGPTPGAADGLPRRSVDCYVQLAGSFAPARSAQGAEGATLIHRVDTVASLSPLLALDAAVLLVADERGWDPARRRTLHVLAGAAVAERVGSDARVVVVDSGEAGEIAAAARRELDQARAASLADLAPGLGYAQWRDEVLSLTSGTEPTYFAWRRPDGVRRVAVLRRSVLSPLPGADDGAHGLARAILIDALGPSGASGAGALQSWLEALADDFLEEVIGPRPTEAFELPMHEIAAWIGRRGLLDGTEI
jgi:hypothetical protein